MGVHGMKITNFHYQQAFPQTGYQEFPKWIHMPGYKSQMVETAAEEAVLRARPSLDEGQKAPELPQKVAPVVAQPTKILTGENNEYDLLLQIAQEKNIKIDKRWNVKRLRAHIERETANL